MFRTLLCALLLCPGLALATSAQAAGTSGVNVQIGSALSGPSVTVQPKDTAYSLARRYNLSVETLLSLNNLSSPDLSVGQVLVVSPPTYIVARGDTAFSIARKNGLSVDALLGLNNLSSANLKLGQVLVVRSAAGPASAPAASVSRNVGSTASSTVSTITVTPATAAFPASLPLAASLPEPLPSALLDAVTVIPAQTILAQNTSAQAPSAQTITASIVTTLPTDTLGADWLSSARTLLGVPYVYGGKSRSGTDCSGFVLQVFAPLGLSLPRVSADQAQVGMPVERGQLQSGDLVFFDTEGRGRVTHVGIVVEGNTFINANSFAGRVGLDDLGSRYWATRYLGARRVLGVMAASH